MVHSSVLVGPQIRLTNGHLYSRAAVQGSSQLRLVTVRCKPSAVAAY